MVGRVALGRALVALDGDVPALRARIAQRITGYSYAAAGAGLQAALAQAVARP